MTVHTLSAKLAEIAKRFDGRGDRKTLLSAADAALIAEQLNLLSKLAHSMEQELAVHRLGEANGAGRKILEEAATETLNHLTVDPEGKVLRPDFGRKE